MKKTLRRIAMSICLVPVLAIAASCALYDDKAPTGGYISGDFRSIYTEEELNSAAVTIGDYKVTMDEYLITFENIYNSFSNSYGVDIAEDSETLSKYLDLLTDQFVQDQMVLYQADKLGLNDFTDEQKAEIEEKYNASLKEMYDYYTEYSQSEAGDSATTEEIEKKVDSYILDEAEYYCGKGATIDEYKEYLHEKEIANYLKDLLYEEITKNVEISEEDIEARYDEAAEKDEETYKANPEKYKEECDSFETTGYLSDGQTSVSPLYVPEGYSRVYVITIASDGELSEEYSENKDKMSELKAEYGELAFEVAKNGGNSEAKDRMEEILSEYAELEKSNEEALKELHKDAKKRINNAHKALEDGDDFAKVMYQYTNDDSFKEDGAFAEKGKLISTEYTSKNDWTDEEKAIFAGLDEGEYSEIYLDENGYHIMYCIGAEKSGIKSLKKAKAEIEEMLKTNEKQSTYNMQMEGWCSDTTLTVRNNELIYKLTAIISSDESSEN